MRLLTHPTLIVGVINILIVALIGATIYFTGEAVALIGLVLLQDLPIVQIHQVREGTRLDDEDDSSIGFTARMR